MNKMLFSALGLGLDTATLLCYGLARHYSIGFERPKQEFTKANATREISDAPGVQWMIGGLMTIRMFPHKNNHEQQGQLHHIAQGQDFWKTNHLPLEDNKSLCSNNLIMPV